MKSCSIMNGLRTIGKITVGVVIGVLFFSSCNEKFDNVLTEDYGESGTDYQQGKVLLIMVDGAAGKAVQQAVNTAQAPRIRTLIDNSMYTFEGLADSRVNLPHITNDRGWANLLTGITTHGVGNTTDELEDLTAPTFLSLLKSSSKNVTSSLFSPNESIVTVLDKDVDDKNLLANDQAVTSKVVDQITNTSGDISDILIAQLEGVQKSGNVEGFYDEAGAFKSNIITAIHKVDSQIGTMVDALKARPNFAKENWLVIITSNYGGVYTGDRAEGTFYDNPERNTFTLLYSPRLESNLLQPNAGEIKYNYFSPWYSGIGATDRAVVRDGSLFNMGARSTDTKSYTIQFMIYDTWPNSGDGHTILSKRPRLNNGPGWNIRMGVGGGNVMVSFEGSSGWGGDDWYQIRKNNPWRVYTYVYKECGDIDSLISYRDGIEWRKERIWNDEMTTDAPLTIGKIEGSNVGNQGHFFVNNVQFYDVALPPDYLAANYCKTGLDKINGFEYWDNLIGYWPNDREEDYGGGILPDYSKYGSVYNGENAGRSDMVLTNPVWETGNMLDPNVCPNPHAAFFREVFNTVDVSFQIMAWLGVSVDRQWELEGMGWPLRYRVMTN
jgi:hypothetical protein